MKRLVASVFALAFALALGALQAGEVKGKIATIAADHQSFTLTDGSQYSLGEGVSMKGMKPGSKVKVMFETKDGKNVATKVSKSGIRVSTTPEYPG